MSLAKLSRSPFYLIIILLISVLAFPSVAVGQQHKKSSSKRDSLRKSILRRDSLMRTFKRSDTSVNSFLQKIEYYNNSFNQIKNNLSRDIDTTSISAQLPRFEKRVALIRKLIANDHSSTLRYLYTIKDLISRSGDQLDNWQDQLALINGKLAQAQNELSQMRKDSMLKVLPTDTAMRETFMEQKFAVLRKWRKLDSINKRLLLKVGLLQNRVTSANIAILDQTDQIDLKIEDFGLRALSCESKYLWESPPAGVSFEQALNRTMTMNSKLLGFMFSRDTFIHLCGVLLFILFFSWIYFNRRKVLTQKDHPQDILQQTTYVSKYPLAAALVLITVIVPNFYDHPPVVFIEHFIILMMLAVLYLVRKTEPAATFKFLLPLAGVTLAYAASNLFVEISNVDRIAILVLSAMGTWLGVSYLKQVNKHNETAWLPYTKLIVGLFIGLQGIAFICNVLGRFSLSKIIAVTATFNLWQGIALYYTVQIIMESLFLQLEANKRDTGISSYIDFKVLQKKIRNIFNVIAAILWVIMLTQNLSIDDVSYDYVKDLLTESHSIGKNGSFTIGSIITFIAVLWLSSVAARIISYIYDFADQHQSAPLFKKKTRTSILIIKIAIFSIGFLIAVAASGVPLDKITIIISALGVGIGFGLQNIVNNLVSGLILAFEKPVSIGDIIEVDNKSGTIKDIGIRSSRISTSDGAEVIVPNGDLISHHVTNWTLSDSNRRIDLIISVAYGTDLKHAEEVLRGVISNREDIMSVPAPNVLIHNLTDGAVQLRLLFWADDITTWLSLKSIVLTEIYNKLKEAGIKEPSNDREVYIHVRDKE